MQVVCLCTEADPASSADVGWVELSRFVVRVVGGITDAGGEGYDHSPHSPAPGLCLRTSESSKKQN